MVGAGAGAGAGADEGAGAADDGAGAADAGEDDGAADDVDGACAGGRGALGSPETSGMLCGAGTWTAMLARVVVRGVAVVACEIEWPFTVRAATSENTPARPSAPTADDRATRRPARSARSRLVTAGSSGGTNGVMHPVCAEAGHLHHPVWQMFGKAARGLAAGSNSIVRYGATAAGGG